MTNIENKAPTHVSNTLGEINNYNVYKALNSALEEFKIDANSKVRIMDRYKTAMQVEMKKVSEAQDWIDTLISDIKKD